MSELIQTFWSSRWQLSIAAGVLLGLSFPPYPLPFLLFPAWILLYRLSDLTSGYREAVFYGYIAFVIWNLIATYWLMMATVAGGIAAILANAAVMALPFAAQRLFQQHLDSPWTVPFLQAAVWVGYEFLHHHWDLAWPWLALGNAWSVAPSLVQYISLTGYLGISFWVLMVAGLAYQALRHGDELYSHAAIGLAVLLPVLSLIQYRTAEFEPEQAIETVVVQPNLNTYQQYGGYGTAEATLNQLYLLSDSLRTDSTELIVWPENAMRTPLYNVEVADEVPNSAKEFMHRLARQWNTTLITGSIYYEFYPPPIAPPLSKGSESQPYLYYNSALGFYPDSTYRIYRKKNLVPVVERIPFVHFLYAADLFGWYDWIGEQGYGKGYLPVQFNVNGTATPALVCYDSVFPTWVRKYVNRGAGLITIITNDGWWGDTSGHVQHFEYARLRAIEFRRWIVRSANNGISGIIDPLGNAEIKTEYWTKTAFGYDVPVLDEQTVYARWGNWFPWGTIAVSLAGIIVIVARFFYTPERPVD